MAKQEGPPRKREGKGASAKATEEIQQMQVPGWYAVYNAADVLVAEVWAVEEGQAPDTYIAEYWGLYGDDNPWPTAQLGSRLRTLKVVFDETPSALATLGTAADPNTNKPAFKKHCANRERPSDKKKIKKFFYAPATQF